VSALISCAARCSASCRSGGAVASAGPAGEKRRNGVGLLFWFSGGNTTRDAPDLELTSTGASSRDTSFHHRRPAACGQDLWRRHHQTGPAPPWSHCCRL
jgi:hypothetical protein